MSTRSTEHNTFVIERNYPASPARVFAAFSDPALKARWFGGPGKAGQPAYNLDFQIGGRETNYGGPEGGPTYLYEAVFQDIVAEERIIVNYEMFLDGQRISVSLGTTEFIPEGRGTRLKYTEQAVFLDGLDNAAQREEGTRMLFDGLSQFLEENA